MPFDVPTVSKLISDGQSDIEITLDAPLPPLSTEEALNISTSLALRDLYDHQTWISQQIVPSVNSEDDTIIELAISEGVIRKQATYAYGSVQFTGTAPLPVSSELTHSNGNIYTVTSSGSPSGGVVVVEVQAQDAGSAGNLDAGETLTLVSTVSGVNPAGIILADGIASGVDLETIPELLDRLLYRKRNPFAGGALHDYVGWAREVAGVTRAWAFDCWHGKGTVGLAFVYDARDDIQPTYSEKEYMDEYIRRHSDPATGVNVGRPGGIELVTVDLTLKQVPLNIHLIPDTAEKRTAVSANLNILSQTLSPGNTLLLTAVQTAIGSTNGLTDYTIDMTANATSIQTELLVLEVAYV
jgi:uncharacterized phage protein gp47/JayE